MIAEVSEKKMKAFRGKTFGKLRSNRGASLLVALLLFMVCSVVGIVVLTAASAAAGRASKLAENDLRYYSVASAAELLAQELNGQTVSIIREETRTDTTTTVSTMTIDLETGMGSFDEGEPVTEAGTPSCKVTLGSTGEEEAPSGEPAPAGKPFLPGGDRGFLTEMAVRLFFGSPDTAGNYTRYSVDPENENYALDLSFDIGGTRTLVESNEFSLEVADAGGGSMEGLQITGNYSLWSDGVLTISLQNKAGSSTDKDIFTLVITLQPEFRESEDSDSILKNQTFDWDEGDDGSLTYTETVMTEVTTTKISTVTWKVIGIGEKSEVGVGNNLTPENNG